MLTRRQAGLFSAVASAFIIEVDSHLQPDPADETAALLRVLIYKFDNTTFGNDVPTLPQWTGPPSSIVSVQSILFSSLAITLLSAFLAMLGKQWLNRYAATNMRGSPIERSQDRQRKLDGIVAWYFNHVMESLPVMLQAALLLLGCALSRYLWDINTTVASVILSITASGFLFYLFVLVAAAVSESCPYQTPGSHFLRYLWPKVWGLILSTPAYIISTRSVIASSLGNFVRKSRVVETVTQNAEVHNLRRSRSEIVPFVKGVVLKVPVGFVVDAYRFGRAALLALFAIPIVAYRFARRTNTGFYDIYSTLKRRLDLRATPPDLRCISWTLRTSLDKPVHLTALNHLGSFTELTGFDPGIITDCFNVFVGCISFNNHKVEIMEGLEQLATVSLGCFFRTFHHLSVIDPNSGVLVDLRRRYDRVFPFETDFRGLPFYLTIRKIHALAKKRWNPCNSQWDDYTPSNQEHISFARQMVEVAQMEYQLMDHRKVPRWILRFALYSLSLDPPSPPSVVADCLKIVAVDLDCDISSITNSDDRWVKARSIVKFLTKYQRTSGAGYEPHHSEAQSYDRIARHGHYLPVQV